MKDIKSKQDLPSWFKLESYESINQLSDEELMKQIRHRNFFLQCLKNKHTKGTDFSGSRIIEQWELIKKGIPILADTYSWPVEPFKRPVAPEEQSPTLMRTSAVAPLKAFKVINFTHHLIKSGRLIADEETLKVIDDDVYNNNFDMVSGNNPHRYAHMVINLEDNSDKKILADIKKLIPQWREILDIPEPIENLDSKPSHYRKIKDYRIIPLLDLRIWSQLENKKIPHRVLTVVLYPNGEKGETELKQTVLLFTEMILSDDYRAL